MGKRNYVKPSPADYDGPAAPVSVYNLYCGLHRDKVMADLREEAEKAGKKLSIADSGRRLTKMWAECGAETKDQLEEQFGAAKREYEVNLGDWKQSEGYKHYLEAMRVFKMKDETKKAKRVVAEAGHPKKSNSSYMIFGNKKREEIIAKWRSEGKKVDIRILGVTIALEWKALSEEAKRPFAEEAVKLKAEYNAKMEEFKTTDAYQEYRKSLEKTSAKSALSKKEIKQVGKVKKERKEREPRAPKLDAEGNEIPMKTRAPRTKKEVTTAPVSEAPPAEPVADAPQAVDVVPSAPQAVDVVPSAP